MSSGLIYAAEEGTVSLAACFGGQGPVNLHCFDILLDLYKRHATDLDDLLQIASFTLSQLVLQARARSFHGSVGFNLESWLADPTRAPTSTYLAMSPMSFPLNTLISMAHYCIVCQRLQKSPGDFRKLLRSVIGHSQGLLAAVAVAQSDSWSSFYDATVTALTLSFWIGLESHLVNIPSTISASAAEDCSQHGEGQPSPMLAISGLVTSETKSIIATTNVALDQSRRVHLALTNARDSHVLGGPPESLRCVCILLRKFTQPQNLDQSRIPFIKRQRNVTAQFLPISAPYHTPYLEPIVSNVLEAASHSQLMFEELQVPVYHTHTAQNLQDHARQHLLETLTRAVCIEPVAWQDVCRNLNASHLIDFGPEGVEKLVQSNVQGMGCRVVSISNRSSNGRELGDELFSAQLPQGAPNWKRIFRPRLAFDDQGTVRMRTKMTDLLGVPPVMVAGMTPTTVHWDFAAAVMNAGYHVELAGGGYYDEHKFESAIRSLAAVAPAHRGISCNLIYINPKTFGWQLALIKRLISVGVRIHGLTIGAGIPSLENVHDWIQTMGLKHISFKPGTEQGIEQVIEIAKKYPDFPIGLQWTGGRAGGHHSYEDFHAPLLAKYASIRECRNIVLVVGSGFGDAASSMSYLTGTWSRDLGYAEMPLDAIMLGSRMMVAKEAHTSLEAKNLIVRSEGIPSDGPWWKSYDEPVGGIISITSEMGEPMHVIANRGMMLWKELDDTLFIHKDPQKRLEFLRVNRQRLIHRLNQDFARPWFAIDTSGTCVEVEDLTYEETLRRLCELTYNVHEDRWIDDSYHRLITDFVHLAYARFGCDAQCVQERPKDIVDAFCHHSGHGGGEMLYPEDVRAFLSLLRRRGSKPPPFIPALDSHFETWFKKDSLWQSEDVSAVFDRDPERVCIIHGPLAAKYSTTTSQTTKEILDEICQQHIKILLNEGDMPSAPGQVASTPRIASNLAKFSGLSTSTRGNTHVWEFLETGELPSTEVWVRAVESPWLHACLLEEWVYRRGKRITNPIRAAFQPVAGDIVELRLDDVSTVRSVALLQRPSDSPCPTPVLEIEKSDKTRLTVSLIPPDSSRTGNLKFEFTLKSEYGIHSLVDTTATPESAIQSLYAKLWAPEASSAVLEDSLQAEFHSSYLVPSEADVDRFTSMLQRASSSQAQAWNPSGAMPLDYCIVVAWEALMKPLLNPSLGCNLMSLLHRSISFRYLAGAKPLKVGDELCTISRMTALKLQANGKTVEVSADIYRGQQPVVAVKSEFFIQGSLQHHEKQFQVSQEPEMFLHVNSDSTLTLLKSRKWLDLADCNVTVKGCTLVFCLKKLHNYHQDGRIKSTRVTGEILDATASESRTRLGSIDFENSGSRSAVLDFLSRHGHDGTIRRTLDHDQELQASGAKLDAPSDCNLYARLSGDANPIHLSPVFARYAGLPGTVVHGMYTSALVRRHLEWAVGDVDRSRFKSWRASFEGVVRPGDAIRMDFRHTAMVDGRLVMQVQAFTADAKVLEAEAEIEPPRTAFMFCGQGSQEQGMGMALYDREPQIKALWDRAEHHLRETYGFSLLSIVRDNQKRLTVSFGGKRGRQIRSNYLAIIRRSYKDGKLEETSILPGLTPNSSSYTFFHPKGLLMSTQFSQPALALMEMAEFENLRVKGVIPDAAKFAGHSLGEYAALGACTSFMPFEELLSLIFYRGIRMQHALHRSSTGHTGYSMAAVDPSRVGKGFDEQALQRLIRAIHEGTGLLLEVVNYNIHSQQYVCAGHIQPLYVLGKACEDLARIAIPSQVDDETMSSIIMKHQIMAQQLPIDFELTRGKATIPLQGVDIPFHSTVLRPEIEDYRSFLLTKLKREDVSPEELVNRWLPNVIGRPFSLDREYVHGVQRITGSLELKTLLSTLSC